MNLEDYAAFFEAKGLSMAEALAAAVAAAEAELGGAEEY